MGRQHGSVAAVAALLAHVCVVTVLGAAVVGGAAAPRHGTSPLAAASLTATVYQSSGSTGDRLTRKPDLVFTRHAEFNDRAGVAHRGRAGDASGQAYVVAVNASVLKQSIVGFGGAFTEAAAITLQGLRSDLAQQVMDAYFGPDGIHYTLTRVHMGSCDYCVASYSEDPSPGDFDLVNFTVSHDLKTLIPMIHQAQASTVLPFRLFASPWSPPAWMKRNGRMDSSDVPLGLKAGAKYMETWALYFSKFVSAYKDHGIAIDMVTAQNEPTNAPCAWESCAFDPALQAQFVGSYLGPRLATDHPEVDILMLDDNKSLLPEWTDAVFGDPQASKYLAGVGVHWYTGDWFDNVAATKAKYPDKLVIATEACTGPGTVLGQWSRGELYGHDIIGDLANGASGWVDWNMALRVRNCTVAGSQLSPCVTGPNHADPVGDDSPVIGDVVLQRVHYQPQYWYLGQFSKFVPPGSVVVAASSTPVAAASAVHATAPASGKRPRVSDDDDDDNVHMTSYAGLQVVAFLTPPHVPAAYKELPPGERSVVVVVMNQADVTAPFDFVYGAYAASTTVPAHSIQTYILPHES